MPHPVIRRLHGNPDPAAAVAEMLQAVSLIAESVGVDVRASIAGTKPPDPQAWQAGLASLHASLAMIGVRARSPFGDAIAKLKALPTK